MNSNKRNKARSAFCRTLNFENLEPRQLLAADPLVAWGLLPAQPLVAETMDVSFQFSNQGNSPGFGPYVDLVVPRGEAVNEGLSYVTGSASLMDTGVDATVITFDSLGLATHPFAVDGLGQPQQLTANPNDQLVVLQIPFGSYTPDQPAIQVDLKLAVGGEADFGQSLPLTATGGFRYGSDALDNPDIDPMIRAGEVELAVTPGIVTTHIQYIGPENETAVGDHYARSYRVTFDIAEGAVVDDLQLVTRLAASQFLENVRDVSWSGGALEFSPGSTDPGFGRTLTLSASRITGVAGEDGSFIVDFKIPVSDATGDPFVDPVLGDDLVAEATVSAAGTLVRSAATPELPADTVAFVSVPAVHHLQAELLTVQQDVSLAQDNHATSWSPGDVLDYAINFQVADHAILDDAALEFVVPDGQSINLTGAILTLYGLAATNGVSQTFAVTPELTGPAGQGSETYMVDVAQTLADAGLDSRLHGGASAGGFGVAVTGTLSFQAMIQDEFSGTVASGDISVDEGDVFTSQVTATATPVDPETGLATGNVTTDNSQTRNTLRVSQVQTAVHAINGVTHPEVLSVSAGDLVTFSVTRDVRSGDVEDLMLSSFLPLPIFDLAGLQWGDGSQAIPGENQIQYGANDTFQNVPGVNPTLSVDLADNRVKLDYGDIDWSTNETKTIEVLITVRVVDQPFADGLSLTQLANTTQGSSNNGDFSSNALANVKYVRPVLTIEKNVTGSDNSNASLVAAATGAGTDIRGVDAGDVVQFETVVENIGLGPNGAYDTLIRDSIPAGFSIAPGGLQLQVIDGDGLAVPYQGVGTGTSVDLFGDGIELTSAIPAIDDQTDSNRVILRYELVISDAIVANTNHGTLASIEHYAALPSGTSHVTSAIEDDALIAVATSEVANVRVSTDQSHTSGRNVVIGETVTYTATVTVPEGRMDNALLTINAPRGLAFNQVINIAASTAISFDGYSAGDLASRITIDATRSGVRDGGTRLLLPVGGLTNSDADNGVLETIEITYTATVTNDPNNDRGDQRRTTAVWTYDTGADSSDASKVKIVEPALEVVTAYSQTDADALDHVTVTVDIVPGQVLTATAFDVLFSQSLPEGGSYVEDSLVVTGGVSPASISLNNGQINASWASIAIDETAQIQYEITVATDAHAGEELSSDATLSWTSRAGDPGQISSHNDLSYERTGDPSDPGTSANDYSALFQSALQISPVDIQIQLVETNLAHTPGDALTIGESAVYEVTVTVPEGVHSLSIDSFDLVGQASVALQNLTLIAVGGNLTLDSGVVGDEVFPDTNGRLSFDLGTVTNTPDNVASAADRLVFRVTGLVSDIAGNEAGDVAVVAAEAHYQTSTSNALASINLVEPKLILQQTVSTSEVDAGDSVDVTLTIDHDTGGSQTAFEINLTESLLGAGLTFVPGSLEVSGGSLVSGGEAGDSTFTVAGDDLDPLNAIVVTFAVTVAVDAAPGAVFSLSPALAYTSTDLPAGRAYTESLATELSINATTISGLVLLDANQDGVEQYGDRGIGGVLITVSGQDHLGNGVYRTTETLPSGYYEFTGLRAGTYSVIQSQPLGVFDGIEFVGSYGGQTGQDRFDGLLIATGSRGVAAGYVFTESPLTWIEGTVFLDDNVDNVLAENERGIPNIEITLVGTNNLGDSVNRTTFTNTRGYYIFDQLDPGTYTVTEGVTTGYFDAFEQLGTNGGQVLNDAFTGIVVSASSPGKQYNFGEYAPAAINGKVYIDYDRDETLDRYDGLIAGVEVSLTGVNDLGQAVDLSKTTGVDGSYIFESLRPGEYQVHSQPVDGLEPLVSNVGGYLVAPPQGTKKGVPILNGFEQIQLTPGAQALGFNVAHADPLYLPSILAPSFESQVVFSSDNSSESFVVQVTDESATIEFGGQTYSLDNSQTRSIRLLGTFGNDTLTFTGSTNEETVNLYRDYTRIEGTWFETIVYDVETVNFIGGGNEDLARFHDTDGNDVFVASPFSASLTGSAYANSVEGVHRIYAYMSDGFDTVTLTGQEGVRDNFSASSGSAQLYNGDFYLFASDFDTVTSTATDDLDRAYLKGSSGDDLLTAGQYVSQLTGSGFALEANGYHYVNVAGSRGGNDTAVLTGSDTDDFFRSRPQEATFDIDDRRVIARNFSTVQATGGGGHDEARVYDSHDDDVFMADSTTAVIQTPSNETTMHGFDRVYAYMEAGGSDIAMVTGSGDADVFKASPERWTLEGGGAYLSGIGFTNVVADGQSNDKAYLYDSPFHDTLDLTTDSATLSGQRFSNTANGFGKVNSEAGGGNDRVQFQDGAVRSTVRFHEEKATIFGPGFSYNAAGFDTLDAYFATLDGLDSVDLVGRIDFAWLDVDSLDKKYKLSLQINEELDAIDLKKRIGQLVQG